MSKKEKRRLRLKIFGPKYLLLRRNSAFKHLERALVRLGIAETASVIVRCIGPSHPETPQIAFGEPYAESVPVTLKLGVTNFNLSEYVCILRGNTPGWDGSRLVQKLTPLLPESFLVSPVRKVGGHQPPSRTFRSFSKPLMPEASASPLRINQYKSALK